jgi:hypothetical protein
LKNREKMKKKSYICANSSQSELDSYFYDQYEVLDFCEKPLIYRYKTFGSVYNETEPRRPYSCTVYL